MLALNADMLLPTRLTIADEGVKGARLN